MSDSPRRLPSIAKKQTRRSVSLSRNRYKAAKQEANRRGVSLAALVDLALAALVAPQRATISTERDTAHEARELV